MTAKQQLLPRVIDSVRSAGSDNVPYFGGAFEGGYHIQQRAEEFSKLVCLLTAFSPFEANLEIGIAAGGALRFLNEWVDIRRNVVIDDGLHPKASVWRTQNSACVPNLTEFTGNSHSAEAAAFLQEIGLRFDLIAIDGDHSYEGVAADWELVRPFSKPGTLVWFHDICACEGVARLWSRLRETHPVLLETDQLGIGVLRVQ